MSGVNVNGGKVSIHIDAHKLRVPVAAECSFEALVRDLQRRLARIDAPLANLFSSNERFVVVVVVVVLLVQVSFLLNTVSYCCLFLL
jgi:hypothetical protein